MTVEDQLWRGEASVYVHGARREPPRTAILPIREMSHLTEKRVTWEEEAAF